MLIRLRFRVAFLLADLDIAAARVRRAWRVLRGQGVR